MTTTGLEGGLLPRRRPVLRFGPHLLGEAPANLLLVALAAATAAGVTKYLLPALPQRDVIMLTVAALLALLGLCNIHVGVVLTVVVALFSALIRRLFPAVDPSADLAAIAPFIVMAPLAFRCLQRKLAPPLVLIALAVFAASIRTPLSGVSAWINLALPLLAGLAIRSEVSFQRTFALSWLALAVPAFGYGIFQFVHTPSWDARWLVDANFTSAGVPGMPGFRPFATLPAPGPAAYLGVLTVLLAALAPRLWRVPILLRVAAIGVALPFVALGGVRSAWLFGGAALAVGLVTGLSKRTAVPVIGALVVATGLVSQVPAIAASFASRADTLNSLGTDTSFQYRSALLSSAGDYLTLLGRGLGSASNTARDASGGLDNGFIVVLAEGGFVGILALSLFVYGVSRGVSRWGLPFVIFWLLSNLAGFNFGNVITLVVISCASASAAPELSRPSWPRSSR